MPGVPFSRTNWSTREEVLTSDLNRLQILEARDLLDVLGDEGRTDDSRDGSNPQNGQGTRVDGSDRLPTLTSAAAFTMDLGFGQAFWNDGGVTDITSGAEDSQFKVVRWAAQNVPFTTPNAGLPRIDLVVATPALVLTDSASRNIIVDPVARAIAAQNVMKSANPLATIAVVAGTAAAQPVAPAVPAGALALFEVYVPAAAADSTTFKLSRRVQRRSVSVVGTYHGILRNCVPIWDDSVDETATASAIAIDGAATNLSRVLIDGEVISFRGLDLASATIPGVVADAGANSPFAAAAPADNDKVYYLYLCGGRNLPQGSLDGSARFQPAVVVESLVAPNRDGRPSANITTPRGTTQAGALYIGVGYVVKNSTRRKACYVQGDWVYAMTGGPQASFNDSVERVAALHGTNRTAHALNTRPALATVALVTALVAENGTASTPGYFYLGRSNPASATALYPEALMTVQSGVNFYPTKVEFFTRPNSSNQIFAGPVVQLGSFFSFTLQARAWNMAVPRLSE
jgi:hypothetical protein